MSSTLGIRESALNLNFSSTEVVANTNVVENSFNPLIPDLSLPAGFNLDTALKMALHSELAYVQDGDIVIDTLKSQGFSQVFIVNDYEKGTKQDTEVYVAIAKEVIIVSFRGSEGEIEDWVHTNLIATTDEVPWLEKGSGKAHKGFIKALTGKGDPETNTSKTSVMEDLLKIIQDDKKASSKSKKIFITGHSLGGAIATLFAFRLKCLQPTNDNIIVYTFGSPRVFDNKLAAFYNDHESSAMRHRTYRIVHDDDIVPKIAFSHWGYHHVGEHIALESDGEFKLEKEFKEDASFNIFSFAALKNYSSFFYRFFGGLSDHAMGELPQNLGNAHLPKLHLLVSLLLNKGYILALTRANAKHDNLVMNN